MPLQVQPPDVRAQLTGAILAGGRGSRLGGQDKGLFPLAGQPLIRYVLTALAPQVGALLINANRHLDTYRTFGFPVCQDDFGDYYGPLAGLSSLLSHAPSPYLLCVPCDAPKLPLDLAARLWQSLHQANAEISVAHDGVAMQPTFALLRTELQLDLAAALQAGERSLKHWYQSRHWVSVDFSDQVNAFSNLNTPQDCAAFLASETGSSPLVLSRFCAQP